MKQLNELVSQVGAYIVRTGRTQVHDHHMGFWESSANIEGEEEEDEEGNPVDTTIYGYIDHCNGSWEQAEAMHIGMLTLAVTQP